MELLDDIRESWGWTGIQPVEVVGENDLGNLIAKDAEGKYWRICPEDGYCRIVAADRQELDELSQDQEFLRDWHMTDLVNQVRSTLGPLPGGRKYCLKIPGYLGGAYGGDNIGTLSLPELIRFSGHLAKQVHALPDGIELVIEDDKGEPGSED